MENHECLYGRITDDGFQYCRKCHKAFKPSTCEHYWKRKDEFSITNEFGKKEKHTYIRECKKCGELDKLEVAM